VSIGIVGHAKWQVNVERRECRRIAKSEKTAKDAKSAKEQSIKNSYFHRLLLFFLGDLVALGGSKIAGGTDSCSELILQ